jgi:uncharacterized protein
MEIHYLDIALIELLKEHGMIIDKKIDELEVIRKRATNFRKQCDDSSTLGMVISPTNACNLNCPYCYQGDKKHSDTKYLSPENITALKQFVTNTIGNPYAKPITKISVEWFGGEPLLRKREIEDFSMFLLEKVEKHKLEYKAGIITNATLLDAATWDLLHKCRVDDVQITLDGNKDMHDQLRAYHNGKGSYEKILDNLSLMPADKFNVILRINGDKEVFKKIPLLFDDLQERGIWPDPDKKITFHWAPKFYNFLGYNQDKNLYYTSYEYDKSKEDFAKLRVEKYNEWARKNNRPVRQLKVAYPAPAEFYCHTVESPNSIAVDDGGFVHKCFNTINNKTKRIVHLDDFVPEAEGLDHYKHFDKTVQPDCRTCRILPICEENCNMRFVDNAESKICSPWKYFMEERMIAIYEQTFMSENGENAASKIVTRTGVMEIA